MSLYRPILIGTSMLLLMLGSAAARDLGGISNGKEYAALHPDHKNEFSISCSAKVDKATLLTGPDLKKVYRESTESNSFFEIRKGDDFIVKNFVEVDGKQFLAGQLIQYAGQKVYSLENPSSDSGGEGTDILYVLPKDWDCQLYQGSDEAWSGTCKGTMKAYLDLLCKYENKCPTGSK